MAGPEIQFNTQMVEVKRVFAGSLFFVRARINNNIIYTRYECTCTRSRSGRFGAEPGRTRVRRGGGGCDRGSGRGRGSGRRVYSFCFMSVAFSLFLSHSVSFTRSLALLDLDLCFFFGAASENHSRPISYNMCYIWTRAARRKTKKKTGSERTDARARPDHYIEKSYLTAMTYTRTRAHTRPSVPSSRNIRT